MYIEMHRGLACPQCGSMGGSHVCGVVGGSTRRYKARQFSWKTMRYEDVEEGGKDALAGDSVDSGLDLGRMSHGK